jgi:steroid 5-alpha reductase family enzyme
MSKSSNASSLSPEIPAWRQNKVIGLVIMTIAYVVSLGAGIFAVRSIIATDPFWQFGIADFVATLVIFAFSFVFRNSSFYDPYWSVKPAVVAVWLGVFTASGADPNRLRMVVVLMLIYGARLTWNWARGWTGLNHEDWRYEDLARKTGKAYWLVSFSGIHFFPTVLVFLGCLPLFQVFTNPTQPFGFLDLIAAMVLLGGVLIEAAADQQLRNFRLTNKDPKKILETGLWKYARHPNYFGEMLVWWGVALFGLAAGGLVWYTFAGAIAITALFVFISTPMIDQRMLERRPAYAERMKRVSALIPWKPRS